MSIQFAGGINIGGTSSGGANIEGYIPTNTTYTVKTDGTGDFSLLSEAIDFLADKWSTGTINIEMGAGTFIENERINIDEKLIGIPVLKITGAGQANTIIQNTSTAAAIRFGDYKNDCTFSDMTIENTNATPPFAVFQLNRAYGKIKNIKLVNASYVLFVGGALSQLTIQGTSEFDNATNSAIGVQQNSVVVADQTAMTIKNAPTGISILRLANFIFAAGTQTWTSVTNQYSQTVNTVTKEGCIYKD